MISLKFLNYFLSKVKGRKIVIWGAGIIGDFILNYLKEENYTVKFFIDSSEAKRDSLFCGYKVHHPSKIKNSSSEYFILVAVEKFYNSITDTLNNWGYSNESDFFYTTNYEKMVSACEYKDFMDNEIIYKASSNDGQVVFRGGNNKLVIESGVVLGNTTITFRSDNGYCYIGRNSVYKGLINIGKGCKVVIGEQLSVTHNCSISTAEATEIIIGEDCMFANNNQIYSHDFHPIYDECTSDRLNPSKSIKIGNHVWLANEVVVLSGASIADGCVIGLRSVVKSDIPSNSIAVGIPATVKKSNVIWEKKLLL